MLHKSKDLFNVSCLLVHTSNAEIHFTFFRMCQSLGLNFHSLRKTCQMSNLLAHFFLQRFRTFSHLNDNSSSRRRKFSSGLADLHSSPTPPPQLLSYFLTRTCSPPSTDGRMTCCFLFLPDDLYSLLHSAQLINLTLFFFPLRPLRQMLLTPLALDYDKNLGPEVSRRLYNMVEFATKSCRWSGT